MDHLPRPLVELASAEPRGRHTCCSAGGVRNYKGGVTRDVFRSLQDT